jgi:HAD superfamily hydrolase (TIGR01484 family)
MNYLALATDYDGTLAYHGAVRESTLRALEKLRASGRKLILVTGRQLEELLSIFPHSELFEWIVVENGALLYCPQTRESKLLTEQVPPAFVDALRAHDVNDLGVGRAVVATWRPHECAVLDVIRDLGLDRQIIFNKDAVMVLPTGVNKASGLTAAMEEMKISRHNVVAIGDAENDLPMLTLSECGVAVSNALDSVKAKGDLVMNSDHGAGVEELIDELLRDDLASRGPDARHGILLGRAKDKPDQLIWLPSLGQSVLVAGPSGSGKSTLITGLLERMAEANYQLCIFDPEGEYESFEQAINLGNPHYAPTAEDVLSLLERMHCMVVNLLGVSLDSRPKVVSEILRKLEDLRKNYGRPHWFVIDETHHIFPADFPAESTQLPEPPKASLMITVHPPHVRQETLASADIVIAVGKDPHETIRNFCERAQIEAPKLEPVTLERGQVLVWFRHHGEPFIVVAEPGKTEHKRHIRKYAQGDLREGSFVFRGSQDKLNLVANNLNTFIRMAEGVDDETWHHHLRAGDYSEWIRRFVKDDKLADEVQDIESRTGSADDSRNRIIEAIRSKYTSSA